MKNNPLFLLSVVLNAGLLLIIAWLLSVDRPYSGTAVPSGTPVRVAAISPEETVPFEAHPVEHKPGNSGQLVPAANRRSAERVALPPQLSGPPLLMVSPPQPYLPRLASSTTNVTTLPGGTAVPGDVTQNSLQPAHLSTAHENTQRIASNSLAQRPPPQVIGISPNTVGSVSEIQAAAAAGAMSEKSAASLQSNESVESPVRNGKTSQPAVQEPQVATENHFAQAMPSRLSQHMRDTRDKKTMIFSVEQQQQRSMLGWQNFYYEADEESAKQ